MLQEKIVWGVSSKEPLLLLFAHAETQPPGAEQCGCALRCSVVCLHTQVVSLTLQRFLLGVWLIAGF